MTLLTAQQFLGFLTASVLITCTPGPDNLMVLSLGASRGRREGMAFGLGCATGCLSHTFLAAAGISALIAASSWGFALLKVAGGGYLLYLGVQVLRASFATPSSVVGAKAPAGRAGHGPQPEVLHSAWQLFGKGLVANAINPKVVMFFLAFLPQFVLGDRGDTGWQILQLGLLFTLQAAVLFATLGYFAGAVGQWMGRHGRAGQWLDRLAGAVFIALGVKLIVSR